VSGSFVNPARVAREVREREREREGEGEREGQGSLEMEFLEFI
jgi:hypothetical protein